MLDINPQETYAVLIGSSKFPKDPQNFPSIPAVKNNINDLASILANSEIIGIPEQNIIQILDENHADEVAVKLATEANKAEDTLIVYYAGHGLIGRTLEQEGKLFFAVGYTTESHCELNALSFRTVWNVIRESPARKKLLIVDCCFSGRALLTFMANRLNLLQAEIENIQGIYVMTSAPANKSAIALEGEKYTSFTGKLIQALEEGIHNEKKTISLDELYKHIYTELSREKLPEPQKANWKNANNMIIALNRQACVSLETKEYNSIRKKTKEILLNYKKTKKAVLNLSERYDFLRTEFQYNHDVDNLKILQKNLQSLQEEKYIPDIKTSNFDRIKNMIKAVSLQESQLQLLKIIESLKTGYQNQNEEYTACIEILEVNSSNSQIFENKIKRIQDALSRYELSINEFYFNIQQKHTGIESEWIKKTNPIQRFFTLELKNKCNNKKSVQKLFEDTEDEISQIIKSLESKISEDFMQRMKDLKKEFKDKENIHLPIIDVSYVIKIRLDFYNRVKQKICISKIITKESWYKDDYFYKKNTLDDLKNEIILYLNTIIDKFYADISKFIEEYHNLLRGELIKIIKERNKILENLKNKKQKTKEILSELENYKIKKRLVEAELKKLELVLIEIIPIS